MRSVLRTHSSNQRSHEKPSMSSPLNPTDPDEKFIAEGIAFFFAEGTGRYQVMAARRIELGDPGLQRRAVLQAVRFKPGHLRARPQWFLMVWGIDGRSVTFLRQSCRAVMWQRYCGIGHGELRALGLRDAST